MTEQPTNPLQTLSNSLIEAAEKAGKSTVTVHARRRMPASGVVVRADLVLTASHVVERDEDIKVVLADGQEVSASLAGRDLISDLAVLRLTEAIGTPAARASEEPRVGQLVLALGRPHGAVEASMGMVSAISGPVHVQHVHGPHAGHGPRGRHGGRHEGPHGPMGGVLESHLRTDTIPFPGFSGGPLVDVEGKVVGINTSGLTPGSSITIPISTASTVAESLAEHGRVRRGFLGIRSQPVELSSAAQQALGREQAIGLLLVGVDEGTPAAQGGLIVGDILVALAGTPISDPDALLSILSTSPVGQPTSVEVLRGGQPLTLQVVVGERQ